MKFEAFLMGLIAVTVKYLLVVSFLSSCGNRPESKTDRILETITVQETVSVPTMTPETKAEKDYVVFSSDLEVGQWGLDFSKRCTIFKTKRQAIVECEDSPCRKLEEKYLTERYNKNNPKVVFKKQRKLDQCRYKHNMNIIKDDRILEDRKYTHS